MVGKALFKYYFSIAAIMLAVLTMFMLILPSEQYGEECMVVLVATLAYVWIIYIKMRLPEEYTFINSLPISKKEQLDVFYFSTIMFVVSAYIIYILILWLNNNIHMNLEDILISTVTKILLIIFLATLCILYLVHGIPGIKRISAGVLILWLIFVNADTIIRLTILSIRYKDNNPLYLVREKWNLLTIPQNILNSDISGSKYYIPDFSISARRIDFSVYCAIIIILTLALYYRAKKIYSRTDLEKPLISVVEKMHPVFIYIVSCIISIIIAMFVILGRPNENYTDIESVENVNSNNFFWSVKNERMRGTCKEGHFDYYSFQIYDMEKNNKVFALWCGSVAAGILAGAASGTVIILKGRRKKI